MEPWKGVTIGALLVAIVGYGVLQNRPATEAPTDTQNSVQATPTPNAALDAWLGKSPLPWSFAASQWANTPRPLTPADIKGKVTLMEFWRMGCPHCEDAVPFLNAIHKNYGKRLQMVTFQSPGVIDDPENPENSWPKVKEWMAERAVSYPVAFDEGRKLKDQYNVMLYPQVMLIDAKGKIVYVHTGHTAEKERDLMQKLQKLIGK
jgi:thiol-disulfide isomerase/thioredoxin